MIGEVIQLRKLSSSMSSGRFGPDFAKSMTRRWCPNLEIKELFVTQSNQRVDKTGAPCWDVTRGYGNREHQQRYCSAGDGIDRTDLKEQAFQELGKGQRERQSCHQTVSSQLDSLPQDHPKDFAALRTQRHAHPDFLCAQGYCVRNHSVHANNSE